MTISSLLDIDSLELHDFLAIKMKTSLSTQDLTKYLASQLNSVMPDNRQVEPGDLLEHVRTASSKLEFSFSHTRRKYFHDGVDAVFSHLQSDQYSMFLYLVSRAIRESGGDLELASKIYCLNKMLHSIDVYFEVRMPDIFLFRHCVGTVLGRAEYADYFTVGANCTVGNSDGIYPTFHEGVALYNGSMVAGECRIESNAHISAHTLVLNQNVPSGDLAFGRSPELTCKPSRRNVQDRFFNSLA